MPELTLQATDDKLEAAMSFINSLLDPFEPSPRTRGQLCLVCEEIFVNIAHYAYQPNTGTATIRADITPSPHPTLTIQFIDTGKPFNPLENTPPDITLAAEQRNIGGLGIFLVRKIMDSVHYQRLNQNNILTLTKQLDTAQNN